MLQIIITTNDGYANEFKGLVSEQQYVELQGMEYSGEFKRFSLDIQDDDLTGESDFEKAKLFLNHINNN
jgi:hypothetical protein